MSRTTGDQVGLQTNVSADTGKDHGPQQQANPEGGIYKWEPHVNNGQVTMFGTIGFMRTGEFFVSPEPGQAACVGDHPNQTTRLITAYNQLGQNSPQATKVKVPPTMGVLLHLEDTIEAERMEAPMLHATTVTFKDVTVPATDEFNIDIIVTEEVGEPTFFDNSFQQVVEPFTGSRGDTAAG